MPSSRLEVATTAGSRPDFSSSSTIARCSRETEPWCALATITGAPSAVPDCAISSAGGRAGGAPSDPSYEVRSCAGSGWARW